ncbi:MAG TPA: sensor histidine kinase [Flexivirga sp.]|uniref:sensor histidine kinase n=1 Tax=Flexivirga sp. TaxID=1962927 RepID=UPI002BDC17B8|nr:sensor histidine kinase [Flexivirga sp.]HWC24801.1 sensor histidine kinase [Flexivirga sp.]
MSLVEPWRQDALLAGASRRWVRWLPWVVAFVYCAALMPVTLGVLNADYNLNAGIAGTLAVIQTVPLLYAVIRPLQAWCIVFAADVVGALALLTADTAGYAWPFPAMEIVGLVLLCLAVGLRESRRTLVLVWATTIVAGVGLTFLAPDSTSNTAATVIVLSAVALILGAALRERYDAQRRLAEQETISEAERSRRTLLEERARIARELHDVVAHHMSMITVQADTATYRLEGLSPEVQEEFTSIATTARASLGEMRRLLGVLRSEDADGELTPQPGLADIGRLAEATTRAGVPVDVTTCEIEVPETVGLSAYRIVQEALANVVRHAPGAPTRVTVSAGDEKVLVLVVNGPSPEPPESPLEDTGTGQGLVGMRERVRLVGGSLETGPLPDGGFRVAAELPTTAKDFT